MDESIKEFVIDTSFVLNHLLPDESDINADKIFENYKEGKLKLVSSVLLPFEIANGLRSAVLRKRVDKETAIKLLNLFLDYKIELQEVDFEKILSFSLEKSVSVYDASYVYLSRTNHMPLLTGDKTLKNLS